jgi:SAM-dependent methyltransferase
VQGLETALPVLFPSDNKQLSAKTFYRDAPAAGLTNKLLADLLTLVLDDKISFKEPLRVLEVGAGTGSCTSVVLPVLQNSKIPFIYTYTDLSTSFFGNAEAEFGKLDYQILDIEKDPLSQGFCPSQFDLVIAANVLHATQDITDAISHCRMLTKKGGRLLLLEHFRPSRVIDSLFGLLDGYWRFTDRDLRPWHTIVDHRTWESVMKKTGYKNSMSFETCGGLMGVVMGTATDCGTPTSNLCQTKPIWLLLGPRTTLFNKLKQEMEVAGRMIVTNVDQVADLKSLEGLLYLWGTSFESSQVVVTKGFLEIVQQIYNNENTKVVVVTLGSGGVDSDDEPVLPTAGTLYGISRTIRNESKLNVKSVDLQSEDNINTQV